MSTQNQNKVIRSLIDITTHLEFTCKKTKTLGLPCLPRGPPLDLPRMQRGLTFRFSSSVKCWKIGFDPIKFEHKSSGFHPINLKINWKFEIYILNR